MVYRRRTYRRTYRASGRRRSRIRRPIRRTRFRRRRLSNFNQRKSYAFKRNVTLELSVSGTANTLGAFSFALSSVPAFSEFINLFERYRIKGVSMKFVPRESVSDSNVNKGTIYYIVDYDDSIPLSTIDELNERQGVQTRMIAGKPWKLYIRPRFSMNIFNGVASPDAYATGSRQAWISTTSPNVPHYGLKYFVPLPSQSNTIDVQLSYYLEFQGAK